LSASLLIKARAARNIVSGYFMEPSARLHTHKLIIIMRFLQCFVPRWIFYFK